MTSPSIALAQSRPSDAELIVASRLGRLSAYAELSARHLEAARRLSRLLAASTPEADDLVTEAFVGVLHTLQGGGGPDVAFRPYLLNVLRSVHADESLPAGPVVERALVARAFARLPERWQLILWHTEVERESPAQVGRLLGLVPNDVSALIYRARERLRQAFLQEHTHRTTEPACMWAAQRFGAHVPEDAEHVAGCPQCAALYAELGRLDTGLRDMIGGLVLGGLVAAYIGAATAARAGLLVHPWRWAQDSFGTANAAAGLAASAAVVALVVLTGVTEASTGSATRTEHPSGIAARPAPGRTAAPGTPSSPRATPSAQVIPPAPVGISSGAVSRPPGSSGPARPDGPVVPGNPGNPPVVLEADLGLAIGDATAQHGRTPVPVRVSNDGPSATAAITLVLTISGDLGAESGLPGWKCAGQHTVVCTHGPLAAGAATTGTLIVMGQGGGRVTGKVDSPVRDPQGRNNSDTATLHDEHGLQALSVSRARAAILARALGR
ncbi:MAG: hypothetical protein M3O55_03365 [Actinomycetota bacterium]|nr:hypothetical protein [Actinomycetota bacterium]